MKKKFVHVYQFKITLKDIRPPIWREIQVPETYTFWDLHVALQDAMGWFDYHLHEFEMYNPFTMKKEIIGIPDEEMEDYTKVIPDYEQKIAHWFSMENRSAEYTYDFGDGWIHKILLEKILLKDKNIEYPICIKGKRACPPEDCGGIWGYEDFLEAIKDANHERHKELLEWAGGEFDPEYFNVDEIVFDDPNERWKLAFEQD